MNDVRITILVDNKASGLVSEHGLSLWIEAAGMHILFDVGQGAALIPNAAALGIDLAQADALVLSHGHYDHTGPLEEFLRVNTRAPVYYHPSATVPRYGIENRTPHPIGISSESLRALDSLPESRLCPVIGPTPLADGIGISGPVPRRTDFEDVGGPFFLDLAGESPDPIEDDLALWLRTETGLIVCLGCCHAGLVNTLDYLIELTGETRIRAIIGGFHLGNASEERLNKTVDELSRRSPEMIVPCHCTGDRAVRTIRNAFGTRAAIGSAGKTYP